MADDMDADANSEKLASELVRAEIAFVIRYFETAELEARTTERYVLLVLGAMYTYLAAHVSELSRIAWFAPTLVVFFAAVRALGMGWRQGQILTFLKKLEGDLPVARMSGWAHWYKDQPPLITLSAAAFYIFLLAVTFGVAIASQCLFPPYSVVVAMIGRLCAA